MLANRAANLHGAVVARVLDQLLVELVAFISFERVHRRAFRDELRLLRGQARCRRSRIEREVGFAIERGPHHSR